MLVHAALCLALAATAAPPAPGQVQGETVPDGRTFVSLEASAGAGLRARLTGGFGDPVARWLGLELEAMTFTEFGRVAVAMKALLPGLEASVGTAWTRSFRHPFLARADRVSKLDEKGEGARYLALEANVTGYAPLPGGYAMLWVEAHLPLADLGERLLFDESLRAIVGPGVATATRTSWLVSTFGDGLVTGPLLEHLWLGNRSESAWRLGGLIAYRLSPRWQLSAALTTPIGGPDDLPWKDSLWGTGWLRYRWTSR